MGCGVGFVVINVFDVRILGPKAAAKMTVLSFMAKG
jgi:hypothetical protein